MANTIVLGMQWGDEGKGKIVDLLCPAFDAVVRYQGGHNAGHTVKFADRHFSLHLIPSGILHPGMHCVLGNGMVIAPDAFFKELANLEAAGVDATGRLSISDRAQVILPLHVELDQGREAARGAGKIGTTARGIGPTYEMKASRAGLRIADLMAGDLEEKLDHALARSTPELTALGRSLGPGREELLTICRAWADQLRPFVTCTASQLGRWIEEGRNLLFEGAQGALLDVDHGTYPFVTSSSTTAGGVCAGAGVPPSRIDGTIGVIKAYVTRVGAGPFLTELEDASGEHLRARGNEFGTTTGRPRRCGWFDAPAARYARMLNGVDTLALTKLDVLDELAEISVCTGYRHKGTTLEGLPADLSVLDEAEPIYRTVPGWQQETVGILEPAELPQAARDYIALLEDLVGAPIDMISTGPRREETILSGRPELTRLLSGHLDRVLEHRGKP